MSIVVYIMDVRTGAIYMIIAESEDRIEQVKSILLRKGPKLLAKTYGGDPKDYQECVVGVCWAWKSQMRGWHEQIR